MLTDSEKLKNFRNEFRLTQQQLIEKLGVSQGAISMIECGKNKLSLEMKQLIKTKFNYDIDKQQVLESKVTHSYPNVVPIPFYHIKAAANPTGGLIINDYPDNECLYFDRRWLKNVLGVSPNNCSIIEVQGDSMDSGLDKKDDIKEGDILLVDNSYINIVKNKIYVVEINNELLVKKVIQDFTGKITLLSNNPKYPPRVITEADNAIIRGRVVWNGSKEAL